MPFDPRPRRAITLIESAIIVAITAMVAAIVLPATGLLRTEARLAGSRDNLRQIGKAAAQYSAASDDLIAGYSWRLGPGDVGPDGNPAKDFDIGGVTETAHNNLEAAQLQQAAIIRKATGRLQASEPEAISVVADRAPQQRFSLLPLIDWLGGTLPNPLMVSPLDVAHQTFQQNPYDLDALPGGEPQYVEADQSWTVRKIVKLWPYASSYQTTVYAWSGSRPDPNGGLPVELGAGGAGLLIRDAQAIFQQRLTGVAYPSLKVFQFEEFDYTHGLGNEGLYYADAAANINALFFDGSARRVATGDTNPGWDPGDPCDMSRAAQVLYRSIDTRYFPDYTENANSDGDVFMAGYSKWTRGGLLGIDVGGGEVNTSGWCQ